jgi:hypothetical protein
MRAVVGAAAPSSALLLPALAAQAPAVLATLGRAVVTGLRALSCRGPAVLLVAGTPGGGTRVHGGAVTLAGLGLPGIGARLQSDVLPVVRALAGRGCEPGHAVDAPADGTVLAVLLAAAGHAAPPVLLALDPAAGGGAHAEVGRALATWKVGEDGPPLVLLAAGELAAAHGSPAPLPDRAGAQALDDAIAAGLRAGDAAALARLGPQRATELGARGWAPLTALAAALAAAGAAAPDIEVHRPRGVSYLLARPRSA